MYNVFFLYIKNKYNGANPRDDLLPFNYVNKQTISMSVFYKQYVLNLPLPFGCTGDFVTGLSASSSLDDDDAYFGIFVF